MEDADLDKPLENKPKSKSNTKVKIILLSISAAIIIAAAIVLIVLLTKNEDKSGNSETLSVKFSTIEFPSDIQIDDGHYLYDGKIFIHYINKSDEFKMTCFGIISDDGNDFKQLYQGNIVVRQKANGIRLIPFREGKRVYLGDWIMECKNNTKNISDCDENEGVLIDVKYPDEVENNPYTYKTWSEMVVAPDNVHVAWTSLNMACGAINFFGKFELDNNVYKIVDVKIISSINFLTPDEKNSLYLIPNTPRGGEIKQFIEGGYALSLVGTLPDTFVKSVYQSLINEDLITYSHASGYDETSILSPDEKLGISMSTRFSPKTSMAVLGFMPRPYCSLVLSKITQSVYMYSIAGVRLGRTGNIGPVLFEIEKSINDADYQGIDLHDKEDEEYVYCSPISWHPSNLKALWPEVNKDTQLRRLRKIEISGHIVGPYPEIKTTPEDIPYAIDLSEINKVDYEQETKGIIKGKSYGEIEYYNSGFAFSGKQTVKLVYKKFSDDGRNFYNGEEIFEDEINVKSTYTSKVTLSGSEKGKTNFKLSFNTSLEIPKLIKKESEGNVVYRGKELKVDDYVE